MKDTCNYEKNTGSLDNLKQINELFSNAGIKKEQTIVVYNGNNYIKAVGA
ncbi:MAG: hypothetical protein OQK46_09775 [Gammaproteobacteria bacterium]|nr:hypothetical protein [Gammaproteobacteria bacterium]